MRGIVGRTSQRVKGRGWYDLVWSAATHPQLHLNHLAQRMTQSGDWERDEPLTPEKFMGLSREVVDRLDVKQARREAEPFVKAPESLAVWSKAIFHDIVGRIIPV